MSEELKPCPFCGGKPRLDQWVTQSLWNSSDATFSNVTCDECDVTGQDFCDDPSGQEAIEWWNRRAQPAEADGAVETGSDAWMALHLLDRLDVTADEEPRVQQVEEIVRRMGAALSAVTVERDALLEGRVLDAETVSTLEQELRQSRDAYQHMIDQTMPLEPVAGDPRWSKRIELDDVIAERGQLRAEVKRLMTGLTEARYRIEQGRVWNGMGWTLTGLHASGQQKALDAIAAAMAAKEGE